MFHVNPTSFLISWFNSGKYECLSEYMVKIGVQITHPQFQQISTKYAFLIYTIYVYCNTHDDNLWDIFTAYVYFIFYI